MTTFDFSPLYRSFVGFDRLAQLIDATTRNSQSESTYPPYNIERVGDDHYRIIMAVAGFAREELEIEVNNNLLSVKGKKNAVDEGRKFLYKGIAERVFEHRFQLADYVKVTDARMENGLLNLDLIRELPEEMKPRSIEIQTSESGRLLESEKDIAA